MKKKKAANKKKQYSIEIHYTIVADSVNKVPEEFIKQVKKHGIERVFEIGCFSIRERAIVI